MPHKSVKFDFKNKNGEVLAGRLELPAQKPRAFAIFAHCFTCHKNVTAASRISKNLGALGIAVLRFDFTGLGNSDGDFSNTNFSSNVADLVSAFEAIKREFKTPQILIGHSLGGAAVLKAAPLLEDIKAVVTIGAPSDTAHVSHLFESEIPKIEAEGEAKVRLVGREFKIKKQFIEDISEQNILDSLSKTKKAFLIFHSPLDETVAIDHAAKIYKSLKHPKSFITLDTADHLVSAVDDAQYIADSISTWVKKYLPHEEERTDFKGQVLVELRKNFKYTSDIYSQNHHLVADEPKKVKGDDLGMNPYELLLSSLGACTTMTMKMYADRKGYVLDDLRVELTHKKIHVQDCEDCDELGKMLDHIEKKIIIKGDITTEQKERMLEIADKCPVNKTLLSEVRIQKVTE